MRLTDYFRDTRDLTTSYFFVAPVLAFYEVGILALGSEVRNGADLLLRSLFGIVGETGVLAFNMLLLLLSVLAGIQVLKRDRPVIVLGIPVLLESLLYALFFAPVVLFVEYRLLPALSAAEETGETFLHLVLSAGAGVYEEILFRLIVAGGLFYFLERTLRFRRPVAGLLAVLVASLLFSGFHHVGAYGEPFEMHAFLFRFFAGLLLSVIFLTRGLAVAVYTHTLYDILVFLQLG